MKNLIVGAACMLLISCGQSDAEKKQATKAAVKEAIQEMQAGTPADQVSSFQSRTNKKKSENNLKKIALAIMTDAETVQKKKYADDLSRYLIYEGKEIKHESGEASYVFVVSPGSDFTGEGRKIIAYDSHVWRQGRRLVLYESGEVEEVTAEEIHGLKE